MVQTTGSARIRHRFPVVWLLIVWVPAALGQGFSGKVIGVSDGDTITVLKDWTPVKIRCFGIDCPESAQDFGSRARSRTSSLAFGQVVTVEPRAIDRYGRTVAGVILPDGRSLNQELVRQGLAWWYRRYAPHDERLAQLEAEARAAKRGLWSQPNPMPPWEWRGRPRAPLPANLEGKVIANRRSHVYHEPGCKNAASISPGNRVVFDTARAAELAGYRPGKDCHRR
jgi:endonuclease YncB( thermonuclease family)